MCVRMKEKVKERKRERRKERKKDNVRITLRLSVKRRKGIKRRMTFKEKKVDCLS